MRVYADENFATITSFTEFQKETDTEFSNVRTEISQTSSELHGEIKLQAELTDAKFNEVTGDLEELTEVHTSFVQTVDKDYAKINSLASYKFAKYNGKDYTISEAFTQIEQTATKTYAKIDSLASYKFVDYVDVNGKKQTGTVVESLANIKQIADKNYAQISLLSSYQVIKDLDSDISSVDSAVGSLEIWTGKTGNDKLTSYTSIKNAIESISGSKASSAVSEFKLEADKNYAKASLETTVNDLGGHFNMSNNYLYIYYDKHQSKYGGYLYLSSVGITVGNTDSDTNIYGSKVSISVSDRLVLPTNTYIMSGVYKISTKEISDGSGGKVRVVTAGT